MIAQTRLGAKLGGALGPDERNVQGLPAALLLRVSAYQLSARSSSSGATNMLV